MVLHGSPRKLLSYLIIKIVKYPCHNYPKPSKQDCPKKEAESQTPSAISEMDFDDETLNRRVSTYQTSIKPKPQQAVKVKSEKVFHIGLKLDEQFRSEWLQIKYSLALRHGVEISMQKYVEFFMPKLLKKRI
jgi:hypothetical protein